MIQSGPPAPFGNEFVGDCAQRPGRIYDGMRTLNELYGSMALREA